MKGGVRVGGVPLPGEERSVDGAVAHSAPSPENFEYLPRGGDAHSAKRGIAIVSRPSVCPSVLRRLDSPAFGPRRGSHFKTVSAVMNTIETKADDSSICRVLAFLALYQ